MEVFDSSQVQRPSSQARKYSSTKQHKYQFLNYDTILNKTLNQTLRGYQGGSGIQNSASKLIEDQYFNNYVQYNIPDQTIIIQNDSDSIFQDKNRTFSPYLTKNVLNEQLLKVSNQNQKNDRSNAFSKETNLKSLREKMFSVDLNSILRDTPKCKSSRPTPQKNRLLNQSRKRQSDSESLTLINVEQLSHQEKVKRKFKIQQEQNEIDSYFRNTVGISPFKSTFRVKKQQKNRLPESFNKRASQLEENNIENSYSSTFYRYQRQAT